MMSFTPFIWHSEPPKDCPFAPSSLFHELRFTGKSRHYMECPKTYRDHFRIKLPAAIPARHPTNAPLTGMLRNMEKYRFSAITLGDPVPNKPR